MTVYNKIIAIKLLYRLLNLIRSSLITKMRNPKKSHKAPSYNKTRYTAHKVSDRYTTRIMLLPGYRTLTNSNRYTLQDYVS